MAISKELLSEVETVAADLLARVEGVARSFEKARTTVEAEAQATGAPADE